MNEDQVKDIYKERKEINKRKTETGLIAGYKETMSEKLKVRDGKTLKL